MKYYRLQNQVGTKEVGLNIYPQTDGLVGQATFSSSNSYGIFSAHSMPNKFKPVEKIKLAHSANATDFVSSGIISGYGFIISNNVKNILAHHQVVNHNFFPIPVVHRNKEVTGYYWFQMFDPEQSHVDFSRSTFEVRRFSTVIERELQFESMDDFWSRRSHYKPGELFRPSQLYIKPRNLDLLHAGVGTSLTLISEKLLNSFQRMNITGYKADQLSNIIID